MSVTAGLTARRCDQGLHGTRSTRIAVREMPPAGLMMAGGTSAHVSGQQLVQGRAGVPLRVGEKKV